MVVNLPHLARTKARHPLQPLRPRILDPTELPEDVVEDSNFSNTISPLASSLDLRT